METPVEQAESARTTLGASFMNWKGDMALGANLMNQVRYSRALN